MKPFSTPRRRIAWLVAAAVAVVLLDHAWTPLDATEVAVVGAKRQRLQPTSSIADAPGPTTRAAASRSVARAGEQGAPQTDLESIARWKPMRAEVTSTDDAAARADADRGAESPDPFAPVAWAAPAASASRVVQPQPQPPPVAPSFPYAYIGAMSDAGLRTLFFAKGERVLVVKVGDVVDAVWHIDEIDEKQMKLTFVPMNENAVVALGVTR